ncbi:MAG: sigma-70 family RNA polymerase sigma factor [Candidatus Aminicenantes bacterium]|nr:sigma-70 family RNA polymerase sigma factor [Candidatus Aminicenantes bacterium]
MMNTEMTLNCFSISTRCPEYDRIGSKIKETLMDHEAGKDKLIPFELIDRSREGDQDAMESVYEQLKGKLFGVAYWYTQNRAAAEDILQDAFIKIFTNLDRLDDNQAFVSWCYRIVVNTSISYLRKAKRHTQKSVPLNSVKDFVGENKSEEHEDMKKKTLKEALKELPPGLRSVFILHDIQGFKHREVGEILKCSEGTSKSQLFKAREKLRKRLLAQQVI